MLSLELCGASVYSCTHNWLIGACNNHLNRAVVDQVDCRN